MYAAAGPAGGAACHKPGRRVGGIARDGMAVDSQHRVHQKQYTITSVHQNMYWYTLLLRSNSCEGDQLELHDTRTTRPRAYAVPLLEHSITHGRHARGRWRCRMPQAGPTGGRRCATEWPSSSRHRVASPVWCRAPRRSSRSRAACCPRAAPLSLCIYIRDSQGCRYASCVRTRVP